MFKVVLREAGKNKAFQVVAAMQKGKVVKLTANIAIHAAQLSLEKSLPMADSIILATAETYRCVIWTQDTHFQNMEGVKYFPK